MVKTANISIALATYNEEKNLARCLASVKDWVKEIVIVDGGSLDKTVEIAKKYDAKIVVTTNPAIFHINKQKAVDACNSDWIFQLDADEEVSDALKQEILALVDNPNSLDGYYVPRKNYFLGHFLSKGGQYPDYLVRLFKKGKGKFPSQSVHEQISIDGKVGKLSEPLFHYTSPTLKDYWRKADTYTSLTAKEWREKDVPRGVGSFFRFMIILPIATFISLFVRHKGILDGPWGFLFALLSALHFPIAYTKYLRSI